MKSLYLLALLLPCLAHAAPTVVQSLSFDLDGDGKPDLVESLDTGAPDYLTLNVTLSSTGATLSYPRLLQKFAGDTCSAMGHEALAAGPGQTLVWNETLGTDDLSECRYVDHRALRFAYSAGDIHLVDAILHSESWSMGGSAPHITQTYDFRAHTIQLRVEEHHAYNLDRRSHEALRPDCSATATTIEAEGFPICAALPESFLYQELIPEESPNPAGTPTCPDLNGAYSCLWKIDNDSYHEQILVIHRVENKTHRYDFSSDNALIADGKNRLVKHDDISKYYEATRCKRETLQVAKTDWLLLQKDDHRKPLYDRQPFTKSLTTWTQLDLDAKHFSYRETTQYLKDDGTYRMGDPQLMDCVKQEAPSP